MRRPAIRLSLVMLALAIGLMGHAPGRAEPNGQAHPLASSTVGMPGRIEQLVLPGAELEVKPLEDRRTPLVLRITEVYHHGSALRYSMVYYGLEPGGYDLRDYLRRKDGSALGELPPIPVEVVPVLPPGQVEPNALAIERSPWLGGYRLLLAAVGSVWCAGLAAILLLGRRKRASADAETTRSVTLAERLRPLVASAIAGTLSEDRHAELERLLIGYWRKRLGLEQASPPDVIRALRSHAEAGPLLRYLEAWLHQPRGNADPAEAARLLRPYQDLSDDEPAPGAMAAGPTSPSSPREDVS